MPELGLILFYSEELSYWSQIDKGIPTGLHRLQLKKLPTHRFKGTQNSTQRNCLLLQ